MYVINASGETIEFLYGNKQQSLAPNEIFDVAIFDLHKLAQVAKLVSQGVLMIYNDEDEDLEYNEKFHYTQPRSRIIESEPSALDNLSVDVD